MAFIALKWFAGMVPRYGSQHLKGPHATEAENCNLYSGELRPLTKPALAHKFCQPDDSCFRAPIPEDPSVPPEPPPEPPLCVPVSIVTQPTNPDDWSLVEAGTILTLSVVVNADATSPIQYQWLKNSQAIPGAVDSVLTYAVQDADDYASFTVFVQNPCGQEISLPFTIGLVTPAKPCIYYECDAYFTKVLELSPNIYWPMNITADLNAYPTSQLIKDYSGNGNDIPWAGQQPTSLSTATNTLLNYDACDPRLTALLSGAGANLDVRSPPYIQGIPPTNTWTWLAHFQDVSTGTTSANIQLFNYRASDIPVGINDKQWAILLRDGYSVPTDAFIQVQFVGDFCQFPKLETLDPAWRDKFLGIQMWWDGAITQVRLLIDFVVVASATITDEFLKNATPAETYLLSNGQGYESQEHAVWNRVLTDQELLDLKTAYQQNDATYVDPNPDCLPATCNQYACDALETAITALSPDSHYKMTDPVNDRSGTTVIDSGVNGIDLPQVQGNAVIYDYTPPPLPGSCSGTAFWSTSVNSAILDTGASGATPPTYNNLSGEGTIIALWSGLGQGQYNIYWRDSNSTQMLVRLSAMNSSGFTFGMESLVSDGAGTIEINAWPLVAPVVDGGTLVVITFKPVGATTDILVYGSDGVLLLNTNVDGTVGTFGTCYRQSISFTDTAMQNMAFKQAYSDAATVQTILDSYAQNQVSYVDPRTGCIPP